MSADDCAVCLVAEKATAGGEPRREACNTSALGIVCLVALGAPIELCGECADYVRASLALAMLARAPKAGAS